jgi:hypothetical protein
MTVTTTTVDDLFAAYRAAFERYDVAAVAHDELPHLQRLLS